MPTSPTLKERNLARYRVRMMLSIMDRPISADVFKALAKNDDEYEIFCEAITNLLHMRDVIQEDSGIVMRKYPISDKEVPGIISILEVKNFLKYLFDVRPDRPIHMKALIGCAVSGHEKNNILSAIHHLVANGFIKKVGEEIFLAKQAD